MWHIFSLERKQADRFSGIEIPWGTGSIKTVDKIKDLMARSGGAHSTCNIFPMCRIMLAGGSVSPALPVLVCYRQKEGYESEQSLHSQISHSCGLLLSLLSSEVESGIAAWNFLSGKVNVEHTQGEMFFLSRITNSFFSK